MTSQLASSSPFPILHTAHLTLPVFDPSRPSDYEDVVSIYTGSYAARTVGNLGLYTNSDVDARWAKFSSRPTDLPPEKSFPTHPWHLVTLRNDPDTLVGMTSLVHRKPLPSPDLGYFMLEPFVNNGYATEAGKAALKWWTQEMGVENIWAGTFDTNLVSQRVARKIGFVDGGVVRFILSDEVTREGGRLCKWGLGLESQVKGVNPQQFSCE